MSLPLPPEGEVPTQQSWIRLRGTVDATMSMSHLMIKSRVAAGAATPFRDRGMTTSLMSQADETLHCTDTWHERMRLRKHEQVLEELQKWWVTANRNAGNCGKLCKKQYIALQHLLAKALIAPKDYCPDAVSVTALHEWALDSRGASHLVRAAFLDSMFELADLWTFSMKADEYARFLSMLLNRVSKDTRDGRVWRSVEDIRYMSERLWSPDLVPVWHPASHGLPNGAAKPTGSGCKQQQQRASACARRPATASRSSQRQCRKPPFEPFDRRPTTAPSPRLPPRFGHLGVIIDELQIDATAVSKSAPESRLMSPPQSRDASPPPEPSQSKSGTSSPRPASFSEPATSRPPSPTQRMWSELSRMRTELDAAPASATTGPAFMLPVIEPRGVSKQGSLANTWVDTKRLAYDKLRRRSSVRVPVCHQGGREQLSLSSPF